MTDRSKTSIKAGHLHFLKLQPEHARSDWAVFNRHDRTALGIVQWYEPWRCYCFSPADGTLYDAACLRTLADFCASQGNSLAALRQAVEL